MPSSKFDLKQTPRRRSKASDISSLFSQAFSSHKAGDLLEARQRYQQILRIEKSHFDSIQLLGALNIQLQQYAEAAELLKIAAEMEPLFPAIHYNYGNALKELYRFDEAITSYKEAIRLKADYIAAHNNLGVVYREKGKLHDALSSYEMAIQLNPDYAEALNNRGVVLRDLGRLEEAFRDLRKAIEIKADYAEAFNNCGNVLKDLGRFEDSLNSFDRAIALRPNYAEAYSNKGIILSEMQRYEESLQSCQKAITLYPKSSHAFNNRGIALYELQRFDEALLSYDKAIELSPNFAEAHNNRGNALKQLYRFDEALSSYNRAIYLQSDFADAFYNRGLISLQKDISPEALIDYEYRKLRKDPAGNRCFKQPLWLGDFEIEGKTILIHHEQGLGDTIQFSRFLKTMRNAKVLFEPQPQLCKLLGQLDPAISIVSHNSDAYQFDYHCPLLSLPLALKINLNNLPKEVPYLYSEGARTIKWRTFIGGEGFKIGINWQGSQTKVDLGRSFDLIRFYELSKIPGVRLINLHKGGGSGQFLNLPTDMKVEMLGEDFDSGADAFLDTAAAMMCCDLIISSDTATAHLAGALGVPVWVALQQVPDWRWMLDRCDSPWYPTMRLFRQKKPRDWNGVFQEIEEAVREIVQERFGNGAKM